MCLHTKRIKPYIAKKDIVAYKVLCGNKKGLYTPVRLATATVNKLLTNEEEITARTIVNYDSTIHHMYGIKVRRYEYRQVGYIIDGGVYHLFRNKKVAKKYAEHCEGKVYKAIIPEGSKYFSGFGDMLFGCLKPKCYGAREVIYQEL